VDNLSLKRHTSGARHWLWKNNRRRRALPAAQFPHRNADHGYRGAISKVVAAKRRIFRDE
jgi:hypothetical protein